MFNLARSSARLLRPQKLPGISGSRHMSAVMDEIEVVEERSLAGYSASVRHVGCKGEMGLRRGSIFNETKTKLHLNQQPSTAYSSAPCATTRRSVGHNTNIALSRSPTLTYPLKHPFSSRF